MVVVEVEALVEYLVELVEQQDKVGVLEQVVQHLDQDVEQQEQSTLAVAVVVAMTT